MQAKEPVDQQLVVQMWCNSNRIGEESPCKAHNITRRAFASGARGATHGRILRP